MCLEKYNNEKQSNHKIRKSLNDVLTVILLMWFTENWAKTEKHQKALH